MIKNNYIPARRITLLLFPNSGLQDDPLIFGRYHIGALVLDMADHVVSDHH